MAVRCDICGVTSDLDETFTKVRKSFRFKKITFCPACLLKRQTTLIPTFIGWGILLVIGLISVALDPKEGWFFLNLFLTGVFTVLMIIPHELGHAFVAKWLGRRVVKIVFGKGNLLKSGKIFGFAFEARQYPFFAATLFFPKTSTWYRLKHFCIVVTGPIVNFCFFMLAYYIPHSWNLSQSLSRAISPAGCLMLSNAWILFINLFPHRVGLSKDKIPNDGLSLLLIPFIKKSKIDELLPLYYATKGDEFLRSKQFGLAKASYLQGLSQFPNNSHLKNGVAVAQMEMGNFNDARLIFSELIEKSDANNKIFHALLLNNLACTNILFDCKEYLEEADMLSAQVHQSFPWVPIFKGTRGMVLVEKGELDKGIELLKQAVQENEEPRHKAIDTAYIAIAEFRKGNVKTAEQYLKRHRGQAYTFDKKRHGVRSQLLTKINKMPRSGYANPISF